MKAKPGECPAAIAALVASIMSLVYLVLYCLGKYTNLGSSLYLKKNLPSLPHKSLFVTFANFTSNFFAHLIHITEIEQMP